MMSKAVLVTGASTGIGRKIVEVLAEQGNYVYAGARKQADLDSLNEIDNVQSVRLDVTDQEQIDAAVATVNDGGRGLYGLVNNAGVFIVGPIIDVSLDEFQWLMDVNLFGVYRVTQAFAPMIVEEKGRITTIGSISGIGSDKFNGQYCMSKHAIEAFTDTLAMEMETLDVQVSVIEPGDYDSEIDATARDRMIGRDYAKDDSYFTEDSREWIGGFSDRSRYKDPDEVAEAAVHALFADKPLRRYMVVPDEDEANWTISEHIEKLVQLNEWQAYSYSREELIAMLDKALVKAAPRQAPRGV
jgi:NAD(P)-dependent dehydrogenase (short-subunit alcohol dehydrogenase family)